MFSESKKSQEYLGQISQNIEEKISLIKDAIDCGILPRDAENRISILELGLGGGDSVKRLREVTDKTDVHIFGVDIVPEIAHTASSEFSIPSVVADAGHLPFRDSSMSAINASAIFHEISSYGVQILENRVFGREAIDIVIKEAKRVLLPGGILAYRDVISPLEDLQREKAVAYREKSWDKFIFWFVPEFIDSGPNFYAKEKIKISTFDKGVEVVAPVGLHREIQRHYLTLRDRAKAWLSKIDSTKEHSSEEIDGLIESALSDGASNEFRKVCETWKQGEGKEWYIYMSPTDMIISACHDSADGYVLFPESVSKMKILSRPEYSRYLEGVIDKPEYEGKLLISFSKIKLESALRILQASFSSNINIDNILDRQRILNVLKK